MICFSVHASGAKASPTAPLVSTCLNQHEKSAFSDDSRNGHEHWHPSRRRVCLCKEPTQRTLSRARRPSRSNRGGARVQSGDCTATQAAEFCRSSRRGAGLPACPSLHGAEGGGGAARCARAGFRAYTQEGRHGRLRDLDCERPRDRIDLSIARSDWVRLTACRCTASAYANLRSKFIVATVLRQTRRPYRLALR